MAFGNKSTKFFSTIKCFGKVEVGGAKKALTMEKSALVVLVPNLNAKHHYDSLKIKVTISLKKFY